MILNNGKLLRVDTPSGASSSGNTIYSTGAAISVDVFIDDPSGSVKWGASAKVKEATAVLFVALEDVPAGVAIVEDCVVSAELETDGSPTAYQVLEVRKRILDGLDHLEVFLKAA